MTWLDLPADHPYGIHNLPYGVFSTPGTEPRVGVRVGDHVLDVGACAEQAGDGVGRGVAARRRSTRSSPKGVRRGARPAPGSSSS